MKTLAIVLALALASTGTAPGMRDEFTPLGTPMTGAAGFVEISRAHGITVYQDQDSPIIRIAAEGIISAAPLHNGKASFEQWMWLASWR